MNIENLIDHPHAASQLARWHHREWHHLYPGETLQDFTEELLESLKGKAVPVTLVLADPQGVWGSASVLEQDMNTNSHLGPWLANVYIHPDKRGQGLGKRLIAAVMEQCRKQGLRKLYLFTPGQEYFYQTLGWSVLRREYYQGKKVSIMRADLTD
jgi:GNAT superfamily N-acetyltransferase